MEREGNVSRTERDEKQIMWEKNICKEHILYCRYTVSCIRYPVNAELLLLWKNSCYVGLRQIYKVVHVCSLQIREFTAYTVCRVCECAYLSLWSFKQIYLKQNIQVWGKIWCFKTEEEIKRWTLFAVFWQLHLWMNVSRGVSSTMEEIVSIFIAVGRIHRLNNGCVMESVLP